MKTRHPIPTVSAAFSIPRLGVKPLRVICGCGDVGPYERFFHGKEVVVEDPNTKRPVRSFKRCTLQDPPRRGTLVRYTQI